MNTLKDQLLSAGLVTAEAASRHASVVRSGNGLRQPQYLKAAQGSGARVDGFVLLSDLSRVQSAAEFKAIAKQILLRNPLEIRGVIAAMLSFRGMEGWGDLPRIIFKVRDQLARCPADKREQFLSRALRRNNPQFNIPE